MEGERERASLEFVEKSYQELNSKKIKDSLSAFLDDIPGEGCFSMAIQVLV